MDERMGGRSGLDLPISSRRKSAANAGRSGAANSSSAVGFAHAAAASDAATAASSAAAVLRRKPRSAIPPVSTIRSAAATIRPSASAVRSTAVVSAAASIRSSLGGKKRYIVLCRFVIVIVSPALFIARYEAGCVASSENVRIQYSTNESIQRTKKQSINIYPRDSPSCSVLQPAQKSSTTISANIVDFSLGNTKGVPADRKRERW